MEHLKQVRTLCHQIYAQNIKGHLQVPDSPEAFARYLHENRLAHVLPEYHTEYQQFEAQVSEAVRKLDQILGAKRYALIKTISSYPHITSDIDVLVPSAHDASRAHAALKKQTPHPVPIDINHVVSWTESEEVSHRFIWDHMREHRIDNRVVLVPDPHLDTLIRIGHIPFELAEIRLGELMHIYATMQHVDITILEQEAHKMKWSQTFARMKALLDAMHKGLYGVYLFQDEHHPVSWIIHQLKFPYRLSYVRLLQAVIEKRSWGKIKGARYIIRDRFPWLRHLIS